MRKTLSPLRIESLESRIAPALITVGFSKGALTLTGDTGAHDFTLTALDAATTQLKAAAGTMFHMDGVADTDTLLLTGAIKSINATLGGAADQFGLVGLNVSGDVTIAGGAGANTVDIDSVTIKGGLKITGGADADTVNVVDGNFTVKKDLVLELGDGANTVTSSALFQIGKNLTYTGGSGADNVALTAGSFSVGANLALTVGAGSASINLSSPSTPTTFAVGKSFTFDSTGSLAADTVSLILGGYSTRIGADIHVTDGAGNLVFETQSIAAAGFRGKVFVTTGAGTSNIELALYQFFAKAITVDASAATSSTFTIGGFATSFTTSVNYTGGSGIDHVNIQAYNYAKGGLNTSFVADLGDGANTVQATSIGGFFKSVKLTSGSGNDDLQLTALGAKSSSVDIQSGGGTDQTQLIFLDSTISGNIHVASADTAVMSKVSISCLNTVVGNLDFALAGSGSQVQLAVPVSFGYTNGLTVKKTIHVAGGPGADSVDFVGATNVKVAGGINLELGDGANSVDGPAENLFTKSFAVTGGSGADTVTLAVSGNLGAITLALGAGVNSASITGGAAPLAVAALTYGSTSATGEADSLTIARVIVTKNLSAKFGAGASTFLVDDSVINGTFTGETGDGADMVRIDTTDTYTGTVLAKAAVLNLGGDNDTLVLGGNGTSELLTTKSTFTIDGGAGTNTLTDGPGNVYAKPLASTGF